MAKLPVAGRVKTRLCPPLTGEQAAGVHAALLRHKLRRLRETREIDQISWAYTGGTQADAEKLAADVRLDRANSEEADDPFELFEQSEGDLGDRLVAAVSHGGPQDSILFFGIDSPHVPAASIATAVQLLRSGRDVIGPCDDGGFWCLGVSPEADVAALLRSVDWSSGHELSQVQANAERAGRPLGEAPAFWDVDRPADLARLLADLAQAPAESPHGRLRGRLEALSLPDLSAY